MTARPRVPSRVQRLETELELYRLWVQRVNEVVTRASQGDLEARVLRCNVGGELEKLGHGVNHLLDVTDAFARESKAALHSASRGEYHRKLILRGLPGTFRTASELINTASGVMASHAASMREVEANRTRTAATFEQTFERVVSAVAASATELQATAGQLVERSNTASEQTNAAAAGAEQMSTNVQSVAAATEELNTSATEIRRQADCSAKLAREAVAEVERSRGVMTDLTNASDQISNAVKLISDIAKQTNLLALNATIEAARVGSLGKGFAVVAAEVKSLARQTSGATEQIADMVASIQKASRLGVEAISRIDGGIRGLEGATATIERSAGDQRTASDEISRNVQEAASGTRALSSNCAAVAAAVSDARDASQAVHTVASDLSKRAEELNAAASSFLSTLR